MIFGQMGISIFSWAISPAQGTVLGAIPIGEYEARTCPGFRFDLGDFFVLAAKTEISFSLS